MDWVAGFEQSAWPAVSQSQVAFHRRPIRYGTGCFGNRAHHSTVPSACRVCLRNSSSQLDGNAERQPRSGAGLVEEPAAMSLRRKLLLVFSLTVAVSVRSEEHTSELQSRFDLVCR